MMRETAAVFLVSALLGMPVLAVAQTSVPTGNATSGGEVAERRVQPGADSVLVPNVAAQVPTTQSTTGSSPSDDSNSASARGGPGTGVVPGTSVNR